MAKVSVIIPCYNLGEFIEEAVESVLNQTYSDFEIIIINDGSTDEYTNKLLKVAKWPKTKIYTTANQGLPATRNYGIERASGEYICCLDADDKYYHQFIEKTVAIFENDTIKEYGIVSTWVEVFGENEFTWEISDYDPILLFEGNPLHVASLFRKKIWEMVGGYKTNLAGYQDWDFWINIISNNYKWFVVKEKLFFYRDRKDSMVKYSDQNKKALIEQVVENNIAFFKKHVKDIMLSKVEKDRIIQEKDRIIQEKDRIIQEKDKIIKFVRSSILYKFCSRIGLINLVKNYIIDNKNYKQGVIKKIDKVNRFNKKNIIFSVIIPIYDRDWELREAIESVLNQSFQNFELILVCDGSPENTLDVVESYRNNEKVIIYKYPDSSGNACRGRNKGIELSRGQIVTFLDSDDKCCKDRLYKSLYHFYDKKADLVYGKVKLIVDDSSKRNGIPNGSISKINDYNFEDLQNGNFIHTSTVSVKKSCLLKWGAFRPEMRYREDHELWLRLAYRGCKFYGIDEVLSYYRVHANNAELKFIANDAHWKKLMNEKYKEEYYGKQDK